MGNTMTMTHPDGRTATVNLKVAAFLKREGWTEAKPKPAPKAKAAQAATED